MKATPAGEEPPDPPWDSAWRLAALSLGARGDRALRQGDFPLYDSGRRNLPRRCSRCWISWYVRSNHGEFSEKLRPTFVSSYFAVLSDPLDSLLHLVF